MPEGVIAGVASLIAALFGQFRQSSRPERVRRSIAATIDLRDKVPSETEFDGTRERLALHIAEQTDLLVKLERRGMERQYDPAQLLIASLFGAPLIYVAVRLWQAGDDWYWKALTFIAGFFAFMMFWAGVSGFLKPTRTKKASPDGTE